MCCWILPGYPGFPAIMLSVQPVQLSMDSAVRYKSSGCVCACARCCLVLLKSYSLQLLKAGIPLDRIIVRLIKDKFLQFYFKGGFLSSESFFSSKEK